MIQIEQMNFSVGSFSLRDVSLHVQPGEYFVLLGPTGSGKTLLIECLCGLNRIDSGRILIGGTEVTHREPRRRGVGYLPQDYALFPHRTVRQNIRFGLENRRLRRVSIGQQVDQLMERLDVGHLADRRPGKLSGGEKQRVALARALAIQPQVLLLDEPVSALDEQTRDNLCRQLKQLHGTTQTTTIHVCHNFAEMLAVADRVGIIQQGRILQVGTPQEILGRPLSTRVARFVQAGNLFSASARLDGDWVRLASAGGIEFCASRWGVCADAIPHHRRSRSGSVAGEVVVMVRPENVRLASARPENLPPRTTVLEGSVRDVVDLGPLVKVSVACGLEMELLAFLGKKEYDLCHVGVADRVYLAVASEDVHVMEE